MNIGHAIILGMIQGLTEFLPVSSSGHLVLFQKMAGLENDQLYFDVCLHAGTLLAVLWVYRQSVWEMIQNPTGILARKVLAASIPTAVIGLLFRDKFELLFSSGETIGIEFLITGTMIWWSEMLASGVKKLPNTTYKDAIWIGILQGAAIFPAISRSGFTISTALARGLDREFAAEFSFLVSIPVIAGALILEGHKVFVTGGVASLFSLPTLLATCVAAISGYIAIRYMLRFIKLYSLRIFAYYTWAIGILIIMDQIWFHLFF